MKKFFFAATLLISSNAIAEIEKLSPKQALNHVGKKATVCGTIVEISNFGNDTFVNIDKPHPYQQIYFYLNQNLDKKYLFKKVCGTGRIEKHKGKMQIKISDMRNLSLN